MHGLADDNVVAAHTLQLSSALLAAGRPHEVLPLVGVTHMTPQEQVAENLLLHQLDFLRRSLRLTEHYGVSDERPAGGVLPRRRRARHGRQRAHRRARAAGAGDGRRPTRSREVEIDTIRQISDDWRDGDFTFDKYVGPAIVKAQDAITKDEVLELIDDIDQRISSRVLRRALFSAAREVAGVDADV